jgi:opacity protein-like surface antigen
MKRILLAAAAVAVLATPALAADPFAVAYGNTVTQTFPDGTKMTTYVNADMTWQQTRGGKTTKGTYAWKDATHVCFTVVDPAPADPTKATGCNEIKGDHKLGDTWTEQGPNGAMTMSITPGRS